MGVNHIFVTGFTKTGWYTLHEQEISQELIFWRIFLSIVWLYLDETF